MKANEQLDADTITRCQDGNRKAQELLYRNYYRAMMSLCLRYTKNEADATEVLNQGFLKVFLNIQRYDPSQANLYTWIRSIVVNSCLDFLKLKYKNEQTKELEKALDVYVDPEAIRKIDVSVLLHLIRQLPAATQSVFNLYVMEGYSHKEIGQLLNISDGTSKWHLSEARKTLQQLIRLKEVQI